jgi:hypothetical protein
MVFQKIKIDIIRCGIIIQLTLKDNKIMSSSFGKNMLQMRSVEETMNVGKKWTIEEDNKLVQEITENKTYEEISLEHKRTANSIQLRVISHIIYPKIKNDVETDIEKVALEYNIRTKELLYNINKLKMKPQPSKKPIQKPKHGEEPTNTQIFEYLKQLDNKINEINSKLDNLEYLR